MIKTFDSRYYPKILVYVLKKIFTLLKFQEFSMFPFSTLLILFVNSVFFIIKCTSKILNNSLFFANLRFCYMNPVYSIYMTYFKTVHTYAEKYENKAYKFIRNRNM